MPGGRPHKLTRKVSRAIVSVLKLGLPIIDACAEAGVSEGSFYSWQAEAKIAQARRKKKPGDAELIEFLESIKAARSKGKVGLVRSVSRAAIDPKHPNQLKAAMFLLERMHPQEFGRRLIKTFDDEPPQAHA